MSQKVYLRQNKSTKVLIKVPKYFCQKERVAQILSNGSKQRFEKAQTFKTIAGKMSDALGPS